MARLIRIHAAATSEAIEAVRRVVNDSGISPTELRYVAGDLVGDALEVEIPEDTGAEEESALRGVILSTLRDAARAPVPASVEERLDEILDRLTRLEERLASPPAGPDAARPFPDWRPK